jgi:hypothetical protein
MGRLGKTKIGSTLVLSVVLAVDGGGPAAGLQGAVGEVFFA